MSEEWPNAYPQIDQPFGEQSPPPGGPHRRRDDQIRLATRFTQDYPTVCSAHVLVLTAADDTIRCAKFDVLKPSVCQNATTHLIEIIEPANTETPWTRIPSCPEHLAALLPVVMLFAPANRPPKESTNG